MSAQPPEFQPPGRFSPEAIADQSHDLNEGLAAPAQAQQDPEPEISPAQARQGMQRIKSVLGQLARNYTQKGYDARQSVAKAVDEYKYWTSPERTAFAPERQQLSDYVHGRAEEMPDLTAVGTRVDPFSMGAAFDTAAAITDALSEAGMTALQVGFTDPMIGLANLFGAEVEPVDLKAGLQAMYGSVGSDKSLSEAYRERQKQLARFREGQGWLHQRGIGAAGMAGGILGFFGATPAGGVIKHMGKLGEAAAKKVLARDAPKLLGRMAGSAAGFATYDALVAPGAYDEQGNWQAPDGWERMEMATYGAIMGAALPGFVQLGQQAGMRILQRAATDGNRAPFRAMMDWARKTDRIGPRPISPRDAWNDLAHEWIRSGMPGAKMPWSKIQATVAQSAIEGIGFAGLDPHGWAANETVWHDVWAAMWEGDGDRAWDAAGKLLDTTLGVLAIHAGGNVWDIPAWERMQPPPDPRPKPKEITWTPKRPTERQKQGQEKLERAKQGQPAEPTERFNEKTQKFEPIPAPGDSPLAQAGVLRLGWRPGEVKDVDVRGLDPKEVEARWPEGLAKHDLVEIPGTRFNYEVTGDSVRPGKKLAKALGLDPEAELPKEQFEDHLHRAHLISALQTKALVPGREVRAEGVRYHDGQEYRMLFGEILTRPFNTEQSWKPAGKIQLRKPDTVGPEQQQVVAQLVGLRESRPDLFPEHQPMLDAIIDTVSTVDMRLDKSIQEGLGALQDVLPDMQQAPREQVGEALRDLAESLTTTSPEQVIAHRELQQQKASEGMAQDPEMRAAMEQLGEPLPEPGAARQGPLSPKRELTAQETADLGAQEAIQDRPRGTRPTAKPSTESTEPERARQAVQEAVLERKPEAFEDPEFRQRMVEVAEAARREAEERAEGGGKSRKLLDTLEREIEERLEISREDPDVAPEEKVDRETVIQDMYGDPRLSRAERRNLEDYLAEVGVFQPRTKEQIDASVTIGGGKKYDFKRGDQYYEFESWDPLFAKPKPASPMAPKSLAQRRKDLGLGEETRAYAGMPFMAERLPEAGTVLGKGVDWLSGWFSDELPRRLWKASGKRGIGAEVASKAFDAITRAKKNIAGKEARLKKLSRMIGKARELEQVTWDEAGGGVAGGWTRYHQLKDADAGGFLSADRSTMSPAERNILDTADKLTREIRREAHDLGVEVGDLGIVRREATRDVMTRQPTMELQDLLNSGRSEMRDALNEVLAKANNLSLSEVQRRWSETRPLMRRDPIELQRAFKVFPDRLRVGNREIKLLEADPLPQIHHMVRNAAMRLGVIETFGQDKARAEGRAEGELDPLYQDIGAQIRDTHGVHAAETFGDMMRGLHGLPVIKASMPPGMEPGSATYAWVKAHSYMMHALGASAMSKSFLVNPVEPLGTPAQVLGYSRIMKGYKEVSKALVTRKLPQLVEQLAREGYFIRDIHDWRLGGEKGEGFKRAMRVFSQGMLLPFELTQRAAEAVVGIAIREAVADMQAGKGGPLERAIAESLLIAPERAAAMAKGEGAQLEYDRIKTNLVTTLMGTSPGLPAQKSKAQHSRTFRNLIFFTGFYQRQINKLGEHITRWSEGKENAGRHLAAFAVANMVAGMGTDLLRAVFADGWEGVQRWSRETFEGGGESLMSAGYNAILGAPGSWLKDVASGDQGTLWKIGSTILFPLSTWGRLAEASDAAVRRFNPSAGPIAPDSPYRGVDDLLEGAGVFVREINPLARNIGDGLLGFSSIAVAGDDKAKDARASFYKVMKDRNFMQLNPPREPFGLTPEAKDRDAVFLGAMREIVSDVLRGKDSTEIVQSLIEGVRAKGGQSVAASLRARKLLDGSDFKRLLPEQQRGVIKFLGQDYARELVRFDAMLDFWAGVASDF